MMPRNFFARYAGNSDFFAGSVGIVAWHVSGNGFSAQKIGIFASQVMLEITNEQLLETALVCPGTSCSGRMDQAPGGQT
jgi:hypothetical protein